MSHSEDIIDVDIELLTACSNSKVSSKEIQKFISLGADVNCETKNGSTPLIIAVKSGACLDVIKTLVEAGADINAETKDYFGFLVRCVMEKKNYAAKIKDPDNIPKSVLNSIVNEAQKLFLSDERDDYGEDSIVAGSSLLYAAKFNQNVEIIDYLLHNGADISACDEEDRSALIIAAQCNPNPSIIKSLFDNGMPKDELDVALYVACRDNPSLEVVDYLISAGANLELSIDEDGGIFTGPENQTLLNAATHNPNPDMIEKIYKLLNKKGLVSKRDITLVLCDLIDSFEYTANSVKKLVDLGADVNAKIDGEPIIECIVRHTSARKEEREQDLEILRLFVDKGAVISSRMISWEKGLEEVLTPASDDKVKAFVHLIQNSSNAKQVEELLKKGIDPNYVEVVHKLPKEVLKHAIRPIKLEKTEKIIPLMEASTYNTNPEIFAVLVKYGADPNYATKTGRTVLMNAAANNSNPKVIEKLIELGADVNANTYNSTALIYAINRKLYPNSKFDKKAKHELITVLLDAGADVNMADTFGDTPLKHAKKNSDKDIAKLLISYGAK